jgi:hypothetical protein
MEGKRRSSDKIRRHVAGFRARQEARARLPIWLALLMPFMGLSFVFGATAVFVVAAFQIYTVVHGVPPSMGTNAWPALIIIAGSFVAAVAPGFMLANAALWCVPPLRHRLDRNAEGVASAGFRRSMRQLGQATALSGPAGLLLIAVGVLAIGLR